MENVKLLHFTATWCGPCKLMAPMVKEVMRSSPDIEYEKIDIDERPDIVAQVDTSAIPRSSAPHRHRTVGRLDLESGWKGNLNSSGLRFVERSQTRERHQHVRNCRHSAT